MGKIGDFHFRPRGEVTIGGMGKGKSGTALINAWCLYDAGNSAFATTVMAAILPVYFREVAAAGLPANMPSAYWGYTSSLSLLTGALIAPLLGSIADVGGFKKRFLMVFTLIGAVSTGFLYTVGPGDWARALILYALGSLGFTLSMIFYDSLVGQLAAPGQVAEMASEGSAWGGGYAPGAEHGSGSMAPRNPGGKTVIHFGGNLVDSFHVATHETDT